MIKLYTGDSPNGLKVAIALREMQLEHEIINIAPFKDTRSPAYLAINPNGKVPALVDADGVRVWESGAILIHLARKTGKLVPKDEMSHAQALTFVLFEAANVGPTLGGSGIIGQLMRPEAERDNDRIAELQKEMDRLLSILENTLADGREYLAGTYSIADAQLFPGLSKAAKFGVIQPGEHLQAWIERVGARPSVIQAIESMPNAQQIADH